MELEFDKEIDAILRKGRDSRGVLVGDKPPELKKHLDADTIAAFAEGALPDRAKLLYMEHFADCDRCRKQLSEVIVMNRGADAAAASTASAPVEAIAIPWYAKLFRTPNLAIVMGSLVLVFSGVLGFVLLQRQGQEAANNAAISQATEPDTGHGPYYSEGELANANTAANAAPALNAANTAQTYAAPNTVGSASNTAANTAPGAFGRTTTVEEKTADDKRFELDGTTSGLAAAKPAAPVGAAPPPADQPKAALRDEDLVRPADTGAGKDKKEIARAETQESRSRMDREVMPPALKKVGPSRAGPLQNQTQQNASTFDMSVKRSVGGKTFANRNGAWYDTAYRQQATINVRRGSEEFKKLAGGLRSIANELYGVVVVVWKGMAYRIQ